MQINAVYDYNDPEIIIDDEVANDAQATLASIQEQIEEAIDSGDIKTEILSNTFDEESGLGESEIKISLLSYDDYDEYIDIYVLCDISTFSNDVDFDGMTHVVDQNGDNYYFEFDNTDDVCMLTIYDIANHRKIYLESTVYSDEFLQEQSYNSELADNVYSLMIDLGFDIDVTDAVGLASLGIVAGLVGLGCVLMAPLAVTGGAMLAITGGVIATIGAISSFAAGKANNNYMNKTQAKLEGFKGTECYETLDMPTVINLMKTA